MEGNIYINGAIGEMPMEIGVRLIDIIQQVKKQPEATSFNVHINSEGGVVDEGFDIYNYLRSLQLPIKTVGNGLVASIATVIFMAGDTRVLKEGTQFMIHLPWGGMDGTADEMENYSKVLRDAENKLLKFYKEKTGLTDEAIYPLLRNETWLNNEESLNLGFVTMANVPVLAKAYFNLTDNKMTKEDKNWIQSGFDSIIAKLSGKKIVNIVLQDAKGVSIDFPEVMEGEQIPLETPATVDGAPANGEYVMPDGNTYVFVDGKLSSVVEAEGDSEDVEALKAELESLKTQLADQVTATATATATVTEKENLIVAMKKEVTDFKAQIVSKINIDDKKDAKKTEGNEESPYKAMVNKIKNKKWQV